MMNIRPKTARRLMVLASIFAVLAIAGLVVYQSTQRRIARALEANLKEGMAAFAREDYPAALEKLKTVVRRHEDDFETVFAYAKSRAMVETPDRSNVAEAIQLFRLRVLPLKPGDSQSQHILLNLYTQAGFNTEACELADEILKHNTTDPAALKSRAIALRNLRKFDDAIIAAEGWCAAAPHGDALDANLLLMELQLQLKQPRESMIARAQELRQANPDDPRFELLQAIAYAYNNESREALKWLDAAAARPAPDAAFLKRLVNAYDGYGFFLQAQELLEKSADDPAIHALYIQRIWQNAQFEEVVRRLEHLNPADPMSDSQLLAFRAISLFQLKRDSEALPIVQALETRTNEPAALAWATALSVRFVEKDIAAQERVTRLTAASNRVPGNAVIRYLLGESYAQVGENELALGAWRQAAISAGSWAAPHLMSAEVFLRTNRYDSAIAAATEAVKRAPRQLSAITFLATARFRQLEENQDIAQVESLKQIVQAVQNDVPGEPQTLPIHVTLLARDNHKDKAIDQIDKAIATQAANQELMIALADVSRREHLGVEDRIYSAIEQSHGPTAATAFARAARLNAQGQPAKGLEDLLQTAANAPAESALSWQLAEARYRELIRDPGAAALWKSIAEAHPDNVVVQTTLLEESESAWSDRALIVATIDRLQKLTPPEGRSWKLYRAQLLLDNSNGRVPTEAEAGESLQILSEIVRESPRLIKPRLLLARAFVSVRNTPRAIDQLREIRVLQPESTGITFELVRQLQTENRFEEARVLLTELIDANASSPAIQRQAAVQLAAQGDAVRALETLEKLRSAQPDPSLESMLAELYRKLGRLDDARATYDRLLADPTLSNASTLHSAADFFAARGDMTAARSALARLNDLPLPAGEKELIVADFEDRHGVPADAQARYEAAVKIAPTDSRTWRGLVSFHLRQRDYPKAIDACERGLQALPGNSDLLALRATTSTLASNVPSNPQDAAALQPLIDVLSMDPANVAAVEALKAIQDARAKKQTREQLVVILREIADRNTRFVALQNLVIDQYLALDNIAEAMRVAFRTMEVQPNDAQAAQLGVKAALAGNQWNEALVAAQQWRSRTLDNPLAADLIIADVQIRLNRPENALTQLEPYIESARKNPDTSSAVIATYAQALVRAERNTEAEALIAPLAANSKTWRSVWLVLVQNQVDPAIAAKWLESIAKLMPGDLDDQIDLASGWYVLAERSGDTNAFMKARALLSPLANSDNPSPEILKMLAATSQRLGDLPSAARLYRRVLKVEPDVRVKNNLAYVLYLQNTDLPEARALAAQAVDAEPTNPSFRDTLARIESKLGHTDVAVSHFEAALKLDPGNLEIWIGLAQTLTRAGRFDQAKPVLQKIDALLGASPSISKDLAAQLQDARAMLESGL